MSQATRHETQTASLPATAWFDWFTPARLALLISVLLFALYPEVVLGSHSFFYRDFGFFGYPLAHHYRESLWRGEVPLWNPLNNCGLPFLAQWNTMVCYPLSLFYVLLPLPWSLNLFCLGHVVLAGASMYWLALRWVDNRFAASVAGLGYALNGLTLHSLMWPNNIAALAWLPLVVLLVERAWHEGGRLVVLAAFIGAMQMLAGAPEIILFTWLVLATLWLVQASCKQVAAWAGLRRFAAVIGLVTGLTAIQLLPFLDLLAHSQRGRSFGTDVWAMPAWGLANLVVPLFHCSPAILGPYSQNAQQWTSSYYLGIGVLALALVGVAKARTRRVWWLAVVALAGLVLALGENGFLYGWLRRATPLLGLVRYPIKFVVLTLFAVPMLAAFGTGWVLRAQADSPSISRRPLFAVGTFLMLAMLATLAAAFWLPFPDDSWKATWQSAASRALLLAAVLMALGLLVRGTSARARALIGLTVLSLLGLDALTHTPRQNPTVRMQAFKPAELDRSFRPSQRESRAMLSRQSQLFLGQAATPDPLNYYLGARGALYANCNLLENIPKVNGFYSLYLKEEAAVRALIYDLADDFPAPLVDLLGVSQISAPNDPFSWAERQTFLPLATAGQTPLFASATETLEALRSPGFDPRRTVYLPISARGRCAVTNASVAKITAQEFSAHRVRLDVEASDPALVVVAQAFYHPWRAYVDGKPAVLWRANHAFQAVEVPAGRHDVTLVYEDRLFYAGAILSLVTLLGCLIFGLGARKAGGR